MKTVTIFTPTYNRKHTLPRTYESLCRQTCNDFNWLVIDDGSSDGTREWIESLGPKTITSGQKFDWMGRIEEGEDENHFVIQAPNVHIEYVFKPNGGLYTGYNVAYQTIRTELCVCIDSDDFMPDDAVEKIKEKWEELNKEEKKMYCGMMGLDYDIRTNAPISGSFPQDLKQGFFSEIKRVHRGDTKEVMRTDLMKAVAPMIGFEGEKNFNPVYMLMQVCDKHPILVLDENLCNVEYQVGADSMSAGIWRQYWNSPNSFAKLRLLEMSMAHSTWILRFKSCIHYISSCLIAKKYNVFKDSPMKLATIFAFPLGVILYWVVMSKNSKK